MMPSFRKKVAGFIRQFSNPGTGAENEDKPNTTLTNSFILQYLNGAASGSAGAPEVVSSRSFQELPSMEVGALSGVLRAAYTGPAGGLTRVGEGRARRKVDVTDPNLDFVDRKLATARLAEPEDLEEFLHPVSLAPSPRKKSSDEDARWQHCLLNATHNELFSQETAPSSRRSSHNQLTTPTHLHNSLNEVYSEELVAVEEKEVAGVVGWNRGHRKAWGVATTLYERHPVTLRNAGEPIADAFAICARDNSALLVLADGVNWGDKSCLAARCAVHGAVDYINRTAFAQPISNTKEVFVVLLRSLFAAHNLILAEEGQLTTLCVAFVCPLLPLANRKHVVCACNVGDSLAYVFNKTHGVREVTQGSHDIHSMRDMRDALGALGPVDGPNPELSNLTCSMTVVEEGDVVFLTSDGITDNFDPVIGKFAIPKEDNNNRRVKAHHNNQPQTGGNQPQHHRSKSNGHQRNGLTSSEEPGSSAAMDPHLPVVEAHQRHALTLLRMEDLLTNGVNMDDAGCDDAKSVCEALVDFAYKLTVAKRRILEDPDLYLTAEEHHSAVEQKMKRRRLGEKLAMVPGKLDHASVVAYQVGPWVQPPSQPLTEPAKQGPAVRAEGESTEDEAEVEEEDDEEEQEEEEGPGRHQPLSSLSMLCHRSQLKPKEDFESLV